MRNPPAVEELISNPSKLSLTTPIGWECQFTKWIEVEGRGKKFPRMKSSTDMQVRILHSALAFFALMGQAKGLNISFLNTIAFLAFHILHNKNEHFYLILGSCQALILLR